MDLKDLGKKIAGLGLPLLANAVVPGSGPVLAVIAAKLGLTDAEPTPDAISAAIDKDPQAAVKLAEIQAENQQELARIALQRHQADLQAGTADEQERTKRHQADMASDNTLSKNIRPGSLIYLLIITTLLSITDGNLVWHNEAGDVVWKFTVQAAYIQLYELLLGMAFGFYFTSRGLEKITDIIRSWKVTK